MRSKGYGFIPADIARILADSMRDNPTWRLRLLDDGRSIHEDRLHYRPTAKRKSFVQGPRRTLSGPGCRRPAKQADIDHIHA